MKTSAWIGLLMAVGGLFSTAGAEQPAGLPVVKTGDNFQVQLGPIGQSKDALTGKLALEIHPADRWKFAEKAVTAIDIALPKAVKMDKVKLRNPDLAANQPKLRRFEIPYKAAAKGKHELTLKFDFVVCNDELCQKKKFELPYTLNAGS
jgi:hypothetical protein